MTRRAQGDLETQVLKAVWNADREVTPAEVREVVDESVAYTTIMTVLTRLHDKGLLRRRKDGKVFRYRAAVSEADLAAVRMEADLRRASDPQAVLSSFVSTLTDSEQDALRRLLRRRGS